MDREYRKHGKYRKHGTYRTIPLVLAAAAIVSAGSFGLTGCTRPADRGVPGPAMSESETAESQAAESQAAAPNLSVMATEGSDDTMIETGNRLYFKYRDGIFGLTKADDSLEKLYTLEEDESCSVMWVYNNNLYFDIIVDPAAGAGVEPRLMKMDLSTMETQKLTDLSSTAMGIYASDGILYVKYFGSVTAYELKEDGSIGRETELSNTVYGRMPEGTQELYGDVLPYLVEHCGYMPLTNGENLVIADQDGGNVRSVAEVTNTNNVLFAKDAFFALIQEGEDKFVCKRFDPATLESETLFEASGFPALMQYRNGALYYMENSSYAPAGENTRFYRIDVKTKEKTLATEMKSEPGTIGFYSFQGSFYVTGETVYCQQIKDYGVYIEKTLLSVPDEKTMLKTPLYQSLIRNLGTVQAESRTITSADGQKTVAEVYVEKMVFGGDSEAAAAMNRVMEEAYQRELDYGSGMVSPDDETSIGEAWYFQEFRLTYQISGVPYLDENYCCIEASGYEYTGGAHGMPFLEYFIFDRKTGKQLALKDIVSTSEKDLKTLVGAAFRKEAEETHFSFEEPEELEKTVADGVSYESPCYLAEDGIVFYYTPYEIGPYAAGFPKVTIPYSELDLKISLGR